MSFNNYQSPFERFVARGNSVQSPLIECEFCGGEHRYEQCHVTPSNNQEPYYSDMSTFHHAYQPQAEAPIVEDEPSGEERRMVQAIVARSERVSNPLRASALQDIKNEDLEELRELSSGAFGIVYHGKWRGADVAIKWLIEICLTDSSYEQESLDGPGGTPAFVTEFMVNGSLRNVLVSKGRQQLDVRKRLIIALDASIGMEYLHSKKIVRFDLKSDSLLVNLNDPVRPICKVANFGLLKRKQNALVTGGLRGSLPWMAPELLNGSSKVSEKADVFSFGIVLWEILTGDVPYAGMQYGAVIGGTVSDTLRPTVPSYCDLQWKSLMEQCWASDPIVRPSFTEIASSLRTMYNLNELSILMEQCACSKEVMPKNPKMKILWQPPRKGMQKVNFDASFNERTKTGGIGVVIRDEDGFVLASAAIKLPRVMDANMAEATAAKEAIRFAKNIGFNNIILECDSLNIVKALREEGTNFTRFGPIIDECKEVMKTFNRFQAFFIKRDGNRVAHELAKIASNIDQDLYWREEYPPSIHQFVISDADNA